MIWGGSVRTGHCTVSRDLLNGGLHFAHNRPWPISCQRTSLAGNGNPGVVMADVFLSYSSKHRYLTRALAQALEAEGLSVWWDTELEAYATLRDQIDAAPSQARVVVVIWSEGAATSDYVVAEAREAVVKGGKGEQGRLVNTFAPGFNPAQISKPMGEYQAEPVESVDAVVKAIMRR